MNRLLLTLVLAVLAQQVFAQSGTLDVRVDGDGYLRFTRDGRVVYAKTARLKVIDGRLADASGAKLAPAIEASSLQGVTIDLEGNVTKARQPMGRIVLALFTSELEGKDAIGFFVSTTRPILGDPGAGANGVIRTAGTIGAASTGTDSSPIVEQNTAARPPKTSVSTQPKTLGSLAVDKPKSLPKSGIEVTFTDRVEVDDTSFTLGQIATITASQDAATRLSSIPMGDTPPLGIERIIDRGKILVRIKTAGIDPNTVSLIGPDKIRVVRRGQTIKHQQFVEAAIRGAQMKGYSVGLESSTPGPDLSGPIGDLQLVCESLTGNDGELNATIGVYVDGRRFNSRSVKLKTTGAASSLKPGAIVKVRVISHNVRIESTAKVIKVDQTTGLVTVQIVDTGAQLTGKLLPDGTLEVQA